MIPVNLTSEMKELARKMCDETKESLKKREGTNYTGLDVEHRWYCGYLGELAFKRLLDVNKKKYDYEPKTSGEADDGDFVIYIGNYSVVVDVKTACQRTHTKIMIPQKQFDAYDYDLYIGVRLNKPKGEVWGFCEKHEFKLKKKGFDDQEVPTRFMLLRNMRPIEQLLEVMD